MSNTFSIRQPWECPRCHKINGPHVDQCQCEPTDKIVDPVIVPTTAPNGPCQPIWVYYPPTWNPPIVTVSTSNSAFDFWNNPADNEAYDGKQPRGK